MTQTTPEPIAAELRERLKQRGVKYFFGAYVDIHGVPKSKLHVIAKGVPAARFPPADAAHRAAARSYLGLGNQAPVVAYVGALSPTKQCQVQTCRQTSRTTAPLRASH